MDKYIRMIEKEVENNVSKVDKLKFVLKQSVAILYHNDRILASFKEDKPGSGEWYYTIDNTDEPDRRT